MESPKGYELSQVPLDDLLLALEVTKSSVDLSLKSNAGSARLSVHQGRLDHATFGDKSGSDAVLSMLALRDGQFQIREKSSLPHGLNESLASIVQEMSRTGGPTGLPRPPSEPLVSAPLERTNAPLPPGLEPIELRTLAAVNGVRSTLDIAAQEKNSPADSLCAVRNLIRRGLISPSKRVTPAWGTHLPGVTRKTLQSAGPGGPTPPTAVSNVAAPKTDKTIPSSAPPRLRGASSARPENSGYSSVPPPSLAEEHVRPASLRRSKSPGSPPVNGADELGSATRLVPSSGQGRWIESALNAATVSQNSRVHADEDALPQAQEGGHFISSSQGSKEAPASAKSQDSQDALGSPPPRMEGDSLGPDPVVVAAARGQLRDSEMPLPGSLLGRAELDQLEELNEAVSSSRVPRLPNLRSDELSQDFAIPGSVPHPDALPGKAERKDSNLPTVGRYEVLARLKRGGMGSVYMCRLTGSAGFRRLFAMKVLHKHLAEQADALEAFFHEARVLGGLRHRNIVDIVDVGTPLEPYIVLEYIEGGSLAELYRATPTGRDPSMVVAVVLDALNGLSAAHQAVGEDGQPLQLVHCDVTPHNLLVGIDGTCRLTDFGISRTNAVDAAREITRGKPGYVAPERLERQPSDHRSDLFSLGVVLYTGLTGCEPFAAETPEQTMRNVLGKSILPPSETGFRPPPSLDWVCMKALARDPKERFQSAEEMASQLRRIAEREGLLASSNGLAEWVGESLAPTLKARRVASMRGTTTPESRYQPSTIPPPAEEMSTAPASPPSAAEVTGPLEAPPSSYGFRDATEVLSLNEGKSLAPSERSSRVRAIAVYTALAVAVGALVWVVLRPDSVSGLLRIAPEAGQSSGVDQGVRPADAGKSPSQNSEGHPTRDAGDAEEDGIVIPAIVPPGDEQ